MYLGREKVISKTFCGALKGLRVKKATSAVRHLPTRCRAKRWISKNILWFKESVLTVLWCLHLYAYIHFARISWKNIIMDFLLNKSWYVFVVRLMIELKWLWLDIVLAKVTTVHHVPRLTTFERGHGRCSWGRTTINKWSSKLQQENSKVRGVGYSRNFSKIIVLFLIPSVAKPRLTL